MKTENSLTGNNLVIAHRGTTFWAPEETEAAMRWARNTGADYLEFDLRRTKDGVLIALHDNDLKRTTNVEELFPEKASLPVSKFTYRELLTLDAGSWFNSGNLTTGRSGFIGLDILTLEDITRIAEGYRIKRDQHNKRIISEVKGTIVTEYEKDPADNGNRPGLYIETKNPDLFPGIEEDLKIFLTKTGWYHPDKRLKKIDCHEGRNCTGATDARVILQTFSKQSLILLNKTFEPYVPKCFLIWRGSEPSDLKDDDPETFRELIHFAKTNGATIAGPSIGGEPNNYADLLTPLHYTILKQYNFTVHAYSFDTQTQFEKYKKYTDGMFTNKAEETLKLYHKPDGGKSAGLILSDLGY